VGRDGSGPASACASQRHTQHCARAPPLEQQAQVITRPPPRIHNPSPLSSHPPPPRRYLQGKRGIEKAPFALPEFIAATGIARIRETYKEKEDQKTMKQKARERMQPKMAKMDIDYNVLHDAFFRYQTKPKLIGHADLCPPPPPTLTALKQPPSPQSIAFKASHLTSSHPPPPPPSYHEGKEFEISFRDKRPGVLSADLRKVKPLCLHEHACRR